MENSKIEWTHHTANLWHGCVEVHEGCDNCYARVLNNRYHKDAPHWGARTPRLMIKKTFFDLLRFQRDARNEGVIKRVFVGSMMDIFEKDMPLVDGNGKQVYHPDEDSLEMNTGHLRDRLFENITNGLYPNLQFLLLTKRPGNINKYIPQSWRTNGAPCNVMFGASVVNPESVKLVYDLMKVKGRKFLSCEPLLSQINLSTGVKSPADNISIPVLTCVEDHYPMDGYIGDHIDWVICGGESGHGARHMDPEWARDLMNQCKTSCVPFFMKQGSKDWTDYKNIESFPKDLQVRQFPS